MKIRTNIPMQIDLEDEGLFNTKFVVCDELHRINLNTKETDPNDALEIVYRFENNIYSIFYTKVKYLEHIMKILNDDDILYLMDNNTETNIFSLNFNIF